MQYRWLPCLALAGVLAACSEDAPPAAPAPQQSEAPAAPAASSATDEALRAANLAPTGTLRAAFIATNPIHGRVDDRGNVTGPVPEIVAALAARLGVPYQLMPVDSAGAVIMEVDAGTADLGFVAFEPSRAEEVAFGPPFALMQSSYLVAAVSPLQSSADAEQAGNVIGTVRGRSQQLFLSGAGRAADIRIFDDQPDDAEMERLLTSGEIDAFALNRQRSVDLEASRPVLRAIGDSFFDAPQSFVFARGETAKVEAVNAFAAELKAQGFFADALVRADLLSSAGAP